MSLGRYGKMWIDGNSYSIFEVFQSQIELTDVLNNIIQNNGEGETLFVLLHLPSYYCNNLLQNKKNDLITIQNNNSTEINITTTDSTNAIQIIGKDKNNIYKTTSEILWMLWQIRKIAPVRQFIGIPVVCDDIKLNFMKFKEEVLKLAASPSVSTKGVVETIFQSEHKLHMTVIVFSLLDKTEENKVLSTLNDCKEKIISPFLSNLKNTKIRVSGIDCMNSNYSKVHVLFAKACFVDETANATLQNLLDSICNYYSEAGFKRDKAEKVKIHVTLMNSSYRKPFSRNKKRQNRRIPFDASEIIKQYKDFSFGECLLDSIHLSLVSSVGEDGFYKALGTIKI